MNELAGLDASAMAMTVLRLVAWTNVGVAVVWLVVVVLWIAACAIEAGHPETGHPER